MFNKTNIFPDSLFPYQNHFNIQEWLESKNSFLKDYEILGHKFADYLICMGQAMNINPKIILVSLQREQSLVTKTICPAEAVLNEALGVGEYDDGKDNKNFQGFQIQIDKAIDIYLKWFRAEIIPLRINGEVIVPENHFTFALYRYTPHFPAGRLTYDIWRGWFPEDIT